jgi:hypothetical protein
MFFIQSRKIHFLFIAGPYFKISAVTTSTHDFTSQIPTTADDDAESSNDAYINGLLLLFCKNLEMKISQLSVEEKQTLKEIFSRSKSAKEHRKLRQRNPKL